MDIRPIFSRAAQLMQAGKFNDALSVYDQLLAAKIQDAYSLYGAGCCFFNLGMSGVAMHMFFRAIALADEGAPWIGEAWNNLGVALRNEDHVEEAQAAYVRALEVQPENEGFWSNLAGAFINQGAPEKCIEYARQGMKFNRYSPQAGHHYALANLEIGNYREGWAWYNSRLRLPEFHVRDYKCRMWEGERVGILVIHGEQGIGDELMFASLVPKAIERAECVVIECCERLVPVLERSFGVKCYTSEKAVLEDVRPDAWVALGSLPRIFEQYEPLQHRGYVKADPDRVAYWHSRYPGSTVGLSWRGGTKKTHENLRNFSIEKWRRLLLPGLNVISLQYGDWEHERERLGIEQPQTQSFDDHMALVSACDLVISVCNTTIHEAGALGVPCWCLVPSKPAWRYGLHSERMWWYPSVKFYRQQTDWGEVIGRLEADLRGVQATERKVA